MRCIIFIDLSLRLRYKRPTAHEPTLTKGSMKNLTRIPVIATLTTLCMGSALAGPVSSVQVDCSRAAVGEVSIQANNTSLELIDAAKQAYSCFEESNAAVKSKVAQALASAEKTITKEFEPAPPTPCALAPVQAMEIKSWKATHPTGPAGESGGEATVLIQRPISCGQVGTGMFEGTIKNAFTTLVVEDSSVYDMETDISVQKISIRIKKSKK